MMGFSNHTRGPHYLGIPALCQLCVRSWVKLLRRGSATNQVSFSERNNNEEAPICVFGCVLLCNAELAREIVEKATFHKIDGITRFVCLVNYFQVSFDECKVPYTVLVITLPIYICHYRYKV